jgi:hypothetical protein
VTVPAPRAPIDGWRRCPDCQVEWRGSPACWGCGRPCDPLPFGRELFDERAGPRAESVGEPLNL